MYRPKRHQHPLSRMPWAFDLLTCLGGGGRGSGLTSVEFNMWEGSWEFEQMDKLPRFLVYNTQMKIIAEMITQGDFKGNLVSL